MFRHAGMYHKTAKCKSMLIKVLLFPENFGELLNIYKSIETGLAFCRRAMVFSPCTTIK